MEWSQTSLLAALIYNPQRAKGAAYRSPSSFMPRARAKGVDFAMLKEAVKAWRPGRRRRA